MCEFCHRLHIPIFILDGYFSKEPYHLPDSLYYYKDYIFAETLLLYQQAEGLSFKEYYNVIEDKIHHNSGVKSIVTPPEIMLNCYTEFKPDVEIYFDVEKDKVMTIKAKNNKIIYDCNDEINRVFRRKENERI